MVIKSYEFDQSEWVYKGRVVCGDDNIKDSSGVWAIFDEVGSTPTSMAVCCVLCADWFFGTELWWVEFPSDVVSSDLRLLFLVIFGVSMRIVQVNWHDFLWYWLSKLMS